MMNHWMADTKRCAAMGESKPSGGSVEVLSAPGCMWRKEKTEKDWLMRRVVGRESAATTVPCILGQTLWK